MDADETRFTPNESCGVSNVLYQRALSRGVRLGALTELRSGKDRMAFINLLRTQGKPLCDNIGIPYIETNGVHDVTSGAAPFGDFFFCDMLAGIHVFSPGTRVLDFGCSSGRVIRNLKAALPHIDAFGCDPRSSSIDFIAPLVPDVTFFTSNQAPPIADRDLSFDVVFAISVWSHFSEERAIDWFTEMARILVPGGRLIFSTHGMRSVHHFSTVKKSMPHNKAQERLDALRRGEFHFQRYSDTDLDSHWGMAFIPREWPAQNLSDSWVVEAFFPGLAMANQDVYVLARR
jgi:SAM-dependent methyltransferase